MGGSESGGSVGRRAEAVEAAFELVPDAIAVFEGPDLLCRATNKALRAMIGRSIVGLPLRVAMGDLYGQELFELYDRVMTTGERVQAGDFRFELAVPGGVPWELYVDFTLVPWRADDGSVRGVVARALDVTDKVARRRAAEEAAEVELRRFLDARATITAIQDALLPKELPIASGLDIGARYLLAEDETSAGGDWFDAVIRPDGRVALVVGDVVGHGVEASATMGQLRAVLQARLHRDVDPLLDVLADLDDFARSDPSAKAATVCIVEVDPRSGAMTYCTAGHPPPLLIDGDGSARFLDPSDSGPLGVGRRLREAARAELAPGEMVLLYTDGILERRGTTLSQATVDLLRVAGNSRRRGAGGRAERATERVCELTLELLTRTTGHQDDITLLAAERMPATAPLRARYSATPASAASSRKAARAWLHALGTRDDDLTAVQHALGELVANAIEHAYDTHASKLAADAIEVDGDLGADGVLTFRVTDHGTWKESPPSGPDDSRGRGLGLVAGFTDEFELRAGETGTTAAFRVRPGRPVRMLTGGLKTTRPADPADEPFRGEIDAELSARIGRPAVRVGGALDLAGVEQLARLLQQTSGGGTRPIVVHLGAVTHLGSRAVQLLYALRDVDVIAPMGSVAQQVLDRVRLPYRVDHSP